MNELNISDTNEFSNFYSLDYFYADPALAQKKCLDIFTKVFEAKINHYSLRGLFYTTINRFFIADIKLLEHSLILDNILGYCENNGITSVNLKLHKNNTEVYNFYSKRLNQNGVTTILQLHQDQGYWVNSLTTEKSSLIFKNKLKRFATVLAQFGLLTFNYLLPVKKLIPSKKAVFWHSFANNRQQIDYKFLDSLENDGITAIHPNPYLFKSKPNWNKSIYWLGKYSIGPLRFIRVMKEFIFFRKNFNTILEEFDRDMPYFPRKWNSSTMTKAFYFLTYNLLENALVEKLAKDHDLTIVNLFRGGSAAGLIYSGICKQMYNNKSTTNLLVTHGTEFNVIDHFSYFYLDYNVLPSELITRNWEMQLERDYSHYLKYNHCKLIAGGRIDYQLLQTNVTPHQLQPDTIFVGIVLTYNSETYQNTYISDIITAFEKKYGKQKCEFIIKPRPNRVFKPGNYMSENVNVHNADIYSFLNSIDIICGTVSTFGILTMVVTDGIYCNIPGLYYVPNPQFNGSNLGYSYHESMAPYTFNSQLKLDALLSPYDTFEKLIPGLWERNAGTKKYLTFKENANTFLKDLIYTSLGAGVKEL